MERNQAGRGWVSKAIIFSLSASFTGTITGALLGSLGGLLSAELRLTIASILALTALAIGSLELGYRHIKLLQRDSETPQSWLNLGAFRWAALNGVVLGFGATFRLGFWLWYAIPFGSLLLGRPDLGAIIYGTYSTIRSLSVWLLIPSTSHIAWKDYADWLIMHKNAARILANGQLVLLGTVGLLIRI